MKRKVSILISGLLTTTALFAVSSGGDFVLEKYTIDGGGGTSTGGEFILTGTIGQHDASIRDLTGGEFRLSGGFWGLPSDEDSNVIFKDGFEKLPGVQNQLVNNAFEFFSPGANPPFDPPDNWLSFGAEVPFVAVGYDQYATQADDSSVFNPADPGDVSSLFSGFQNSRALKTWGRGIDAGSGNLKQTLGILYQEFTGGMVPAGAKLTLTGWAYVSSVDPLGAGNTAYLVVKCFPDNFSSEYCGGGGGAKSALITSAFPTDTWQQFSVTVESLNAAATIIQAGVEFEQCASGSCNTGAGSVFWDELTFDWE